MTVTLLSKPNCSACFATERALKQNGIDYTKQDVTQDEAAYERAVSLGHMAAPVVIVNETGENWSGYRAERIAALVA